MRLLHQLLGWCSHDRITWPLSPTPGAGAYVCCLECGREFDYQIGVGMGKERCAHAG